MSFVPEHVHLVGSIGLPSGSEVFHTCGRMLEKRLKRIPDGEPGGRPEEVRFDELGYALEARASCQDSLAGRDGLEGLRARIAAGSREPAGE